MLNKTKPSTAKCNDEIYTSYLLSDPLYTSCTRFADLMGNLSHDSINRFLERERFEPKDLFDDVSFDITRDRCLKAMEYMRAHGPFEPHRVSEKELEYTTMPEVMKKLKNRFEKV